MAKRVRTIVTIIDDLSGAELPEGEGETVLYSMDGKHYEIDLSKENAGQFREFMQPIIKASRRQDGKRNGSAGKAKAAVVTAERASAPPELSAGGREVVEGIGVTRLREIETALRKEIRAWARENGWPNQGDQGKLFDGVREAWDAAHPDRPTPPERPSASGGKPRL